MAGTSTNITLKINADISGAKSALTELQSSLQAIQNRNNQSGGLDFGLNKAAESARILQQSLTSAMNVNTGKLDFSAFSASLTKANTNLHTMVTSLNEMGPQGKMAVTQLGTALATAQAPIKNMTSMLGTFGTTLKNTFKWEAASKIVHGIESAFSNAVSYAQDLNKTLTSIQQVSGASFNDMQRFTEQANQAAKRLSTTTKSYADASLIYYQQGDSAEMAAKKAEITLKATNAAFKANAQEMSEMLTSTWNAYQVGADQLEHYVDVMAALGASTATSFEEVSTALQKVGSTANIVGVPIEKLSSMIATISSVTRQAPTTIGTAMNTILNRMSSLKLGETLEDGVDLTKYTQALSSVGVSVLDASGDLRQMGGVIEELGDKWSTLSTAQQSAVAQTIGGVRQYTNIMALFGNWNKYKENLETAENSAGQLQKMQDIFAEGWEGARKRTKAAMEGIYESLIDDKAMINFQNTLTSALESVNDIVKGFGGLPGILLQVAGLMQQSFGGKIQSGVTNVLNNIGSFGKSFASNVAANSVLQTDGKGGVVRSNKFAGITRTLGQVITGRMPSAIERQQAEDLGVLGKTAAQSALKETDPTLQALYNKQAGLYGKQVDMLMGRQTAPTEKQSMGQKVMSSAARMFNGKGALQEQMAMNRAQIDRTGQALQAGEAYRMAMRGGGEADSTFDKIGDLSVSTGSLSLDASDAKFAKVAFNGFQGDASTAGLLKLTDKGELDSVTNGAAALYSAAFSNRFFGNLHEAAGSVAGLDADTATLHEKQALAGKLTQGLSQAYTADKNGTGAAKFLADWGNTTITDTNFKAFQAAASALWEENPTTGSPGELAQRQQDAAARQAALTKEARAGGAKSAKAAESIRAMAFNRAELRSKFADLSGEANAVPEEKALTGWQKFADKAGKVMRTASGALVAGAMGFTQIQTAMDGLKSDSIAQKTSSLINMATGLAQAFSMGGPWGAALYAVTSVIGGIVKTLDDDRQQELENAQKFTEKYSQQVERVKAAAEKYESVADNFKTLQKQMESSQITQESYQESLLSLAESLDIQGASVQALKGNYDQLAQSIQLAIDVGKQQTLAEAEQAVLDAKSNAAKLWQTEGANNNNMEISGGSYRYKNLDTMDSQWTYNGEQRTGFSSVVVKDIADYMGVDFATTFGQTFPYHEKHSVRQLFGGILGKDFSGDNFLSNLSGFNDDIILGETLDDLILTYQKLSKLRSMAFDTDVNEETRAAVNAIFSDADTGRMMNSLDTILGDYTTAQTIVWNEKSKQLLEKQNLDISEYTPEKQSELVEMLLSQVYQIDSSHPLYESAKKSAQKLVYDYASGLSDGGTEATEVQLASANYEKAQKEAKKLSSKNGKDYVDQLADQNAEIWKYTSSATLGTMNEDAQKAFVAQQKEYQKYQSAASVLKTHEATIGDSKFNYQSALTQMYPAVEAMGLKDEVEEVFGPIDLAGISKLSKQVQAQLYNFIIQRSKDIFAQADQEKGFEGGAEINAVIESAVREKYDTFVDTYEDAPWLTKSGAITKNNNKEIITEEDEQGNKHPVFNYSNLMQWYNQNKEDIDYGTKQAIENLQAEVEPLQASRVSSNAIKQPTPTDNQLATRIKNIEAIKTSIDSLDFSNIDSLVSLISQAGVSLEDWIDMTALERAQTQFDLMKATVQQLSESETADPGLIKLYQSKIESMQKDTNDKQLENIQEQGEALEEKYEKVENAAANAMSTLKDQLGDIGDLSFSGIESLAQELEKAGIAGDRVKSILQDIQDAGKKGHTADEVWKEMALATEVALNRMDANNQKAQAYKNLLSSDYDLSDWIEKEEKSREVKPVEPEEIAQTESEMAGQDAEEPETKEPILQPVTYDLTNPEVLEQVKEAVIKPVTLAISVSSATTSAGTIHEIVDKIVQDQKAVLQEAVDEHAEVAKDIAETSQEILEETNEEAEQTIQASEDKKIDIVESSSNKQLEMNEKKIEQNTRAVEKSTQQEVKTVEEAVEQKTETTANGIETTQAMNNEYIEEEIDAAIAGLDTQEQAVDHYFEHYQKNLRQAQTNIEAVKRYNDNKEDLKLGLELGSGSDYDLAKNAKYNYNLMDGIINELTGEHSEDYDKQALQGITTDIVKDINSYLDSADADMQAIGVDLLAGLAVGLQQAGIEMDWGSVLASVHLAEDLMAAFKLVLGIASPSKLTKGLAPYLFEGLQEGLAEGVVNYGDFKLPGLGSKIQKSFSSELTNIDFDQIWADAKQKADKAFDEQFGDANWMPGDAKKAAKEALFQQYLHESLDPIIESEGIEYFDNHKYAADKNINPLEAKAMTEAMDAALTEIGADSLEDIKDDEEKLNAFYEKFKEKLENAAQDLTNANDSVWAEIKDIWVSGLNSIIEIGDKLKQSFYDDFKNTYTAMGKARKAALEGKSMGETFKDDPTELGYLLDAYGGSNMTMNEAMKFMRSKSLPGNFFDNPQFNPYTTYTGKNRGMNVDPNTGYMAPTTYEEYQTNMRASNLLDFLSSPEAAKGYLTQIMNNPKYGADFKQKLTGAGAKFDKNGEIDTTATNLIELAEKLIDEDIFGKLGDMYEDEADFEKGRKELMGLQVAEAYKQEAGALQEYADVLGVSVDQLGLYMSALHDASGVQSELDWDEMSLQQKQFALDTAVRIKQTAEAIETIESLGEKSGAIKQLLGEASSTITDKNDTQEWANLYFQVYQVAEKLFGPGSIPEGFFNAANAAGKEHLELLDEIAKGGDRATEAIEKLESQLAQAWNEKHKFFSPEELEDFGQLGNDAAPGEVLNGAQADAFLSRINEGLSSGTLTEAGAQEIANILGLTLEFEKVADDIADSTEQISDNVKNAAQNMNDANKAGNKANEQAAQRAKLQKELDESTERQAQLKEFLEKAQKAENASTKEGQRNIEMGQKALAAATKNTQDLTNKMNKLNKSSGEMAENAEDAAENMKDQADAAEDVNEKMEKGAEDQEGEGAGNGDEGPEAPDTIQRKIEFDVEVNGDNVQGEIDGIVNGLDATAEIDTAVNNNVYLKEESGTNKFTLGGMGFGWVGQTPVSGFFSMNASGTTTVSVPDDGGGGGKSKATSVSKSRTAAPPKGGGGGGGGGGGSKKQVSKFKTDTPELYHRIEKTQDKYKASLERTQTEKEALFGDKYLSKINQEIKAYKDLIDINKAYQNEINNDYNARQKILQEQYGAQIVDGVIQNYNEIFEAEKKAYNEVQDWWNHLTAEQQETLDNKTKHDLATQRWDQFKTMMDQFEEDESKLEDLRNELQEYANEMSSLQAESIQKKIELYWDVDDRELRRIDRWLNRYDDRLGTQDKYLQQLIDKMYIYSGQTFKENATGLDIVKGTNFGNFTFDGELGELYKRLQEAKKLHDQYLKDGMTGLNDADYAEVVQEISEKWDEVLTNIDSIRDSLKDVYDNTLSLAETDITHYTKQFDHIHTMLESSIELQQLMGRGQNFTELNAFYSAQIATSKAQLAHSTQWIKDLQEQRVMMQRLYDTAKANGLEEEAQIYFNNLKTLDEKIDEAEEARINAWKQNLEDIQHQFENSIDATIKQFKKDCVTLAGIASDTIHDFDDLKSEYEYYTESQERYLSTAKELYEVSKLNRNINSALTKATTSASRAKLKALQDEINAQSKANRLTEYDVKLMDLKYQHALALMELEEIQHSKSVVRLTRDENGNYGYQYTVDDDKLAEAQQKVEDTLQQQNELEASRVAELEKAYIDTQDAYYQKLEEIAKDTTLTYEERQEKIQAAFAQYTESMTYIQQQYTRASNDLTENQLEVQKRYGKTILENTGLLQDQMNSMVGMAIATNSEYSKILANALEKDGTIFAAFNTAQINTADANAAAGSSWDDLTDRTTNYVKSLDDVTKALDGVRKEFADVTKSMVGTFDQWNAQAAILKRVQSSAEGVSQAMAQAIAQFSTGDVATEAGTQGSGSLKRETRYAYTWAYDSGTEKYSGANSGYKTELEAKQAAKSDIAARLTEALQTDKDGQETNQAQIDAIIASVIKTIDISKFTTVTNTSTGESHNVYASGGLIDYTGPAWVDGTFNEPELMLNSHDTENMLAAVEMMREMSSQSFLHMMDVLYSAAMSMASGFSTISAGSIMSTRETLDQTVTIHADFPNVTDRTEIEEAFDDLINRATQYANRK